MGAKKDRPTAAGTVATGTLPAVGLPVDELAAEATPVAATATSESTEESASETPLVETEAPATGVELGEGISMPADGVMRETRLDGAPDPDLPKPVVHCGFCTVDRPCLKAWAAAGYPVAGYADRFGAGAFAEATSWESSAVALGGVAADLTTPMLPPPPPGYYWRRVIECVGSHGFAPDLSVRRHWDEGHIGAFHQNAIDSAPHCFEEL